MTQGIDTLIEAIKTLPIKEALAYLAVNKISNFASDGYEKLNELIRNKYNESKYAFVPDKVEAQKLTQFSADPKYKDIKLLVPNYPYIDLIRTGLLIDFYHARDAPGDRDRVVKIKEQISRRPNSGYLLKIVKLPGTPYFSMIMENMHDFKKMNYSENQIKEAFSETINLWNESSKFIDNWDGKADIISFCTQQIAALKPFFFVLGMRQAAKKVEKVIEKLAAEGVFDKGGYDFKITKLTEGNNPRLEVRFIRKEF